MGEIHGGQQQQAQASSEKPDGIRGTRHGKRDSHRAVGDGQRAQSVARGAVGTAPWREGRVYRRFSVGRIGVVRLGHGWSEYEQKTQQSPGLGRRRARHAGQLKKKRQAFDGMASAVPTPHSGQTIVLISLMVCNDVSPKLQHPVFYRQAETPVCTKKP